MVVTNDWRVLQAQQEAKEREARVEDLATTCLGELPEMFRGSKVLHRSKIYDGFNGDIRSGEKPEVLRYLVDLGFLVDEGKDRYSLKY